MSSKQICLICNGNDCKIGYDLDVFGNYHFCDCPRCGKYIIGGDKFRNTNYLPYFGSEKNNDCVLSADKLQSYMFYHKSDSYILLGNKDIFDEYNERKFKYAIKNVTKEDIENWYPKTFEERIDYILLYLSHHAKFVGETIQIPINEVSTLFFFSNKLGDRNWNDELKFLMCYLGKQDIITKSYQEEDFNHFFAELSITKLIAITLSSKAWEQIYKLQKSKVNNKNVFVAMEFGDDTKLLREKIKEGIRLAGYEPRIMDEIEHNHQIVPEMLYEIRNSKFIIAELSNHNNGAYYEAGYAFGFGKEVIHICSEDALKSDLHFDVVQICAVKYKSIDEIPELLKKRIQATIK